MGNHTAIYYHQHKAKGLCVVCFRDVVPGGILCEHHRTLRQARDQRRILKRIEQGRCSRCGAPLHPEMDEGLRTCIRCRYNIHVLRYRGKNEDPKLDCSEGL